MSEPTDLYGASDIAELFWVEKCTVSNWCRRYPDAPKPDFVTARGHKYWLSLEPWKRWHAVWAQRWE